MLRHPALKQSQMEHEDMMEHLFGTSLWNICSLLPSTSFHFVPLRSTSFHFGPFHALCSRSCWAPPVGTFRYSGDHGDHGDPGDPGLPIAHGWRHWHGAWSMVGSNCGGFSSETCSLMEGSNQRAHCVWVKTCEN